MEILNMIVFKQFNFCFGLKRIYYYKTINLFICKYKQWDDRIREIQ